MSTELAMNAYVLLGNALNHFIRGMGAPVESGVPVDQVRFLYARIEPMTPGRILAEVAALTLEEKAALGAVCRFVILQTAPAETSNILGLPPEAVEETLAGLDL
jgi:hypothetical protein